MAKAISTPIMRCMCCALVAPVSERAIRFVADLADMPFCGPCESEQREANDHIDSAPVGCACAICDGYACRVN